MGDIRLQLSGRRSGRRTAMIDWFLELQAEGKRAVIVTFSTADAERLYRLAHKRDDSVERWQFRSGGESKDKLKGRRIDAFGIDNLEFLLHHITGSHAPIEVVTATLAEDHRAYGRIGSFKLELDTTPLDDRIAAA